MVFALDEVRLAGYNDIIYVESEKQSKPKKTYSKHILSFYLVQGLQARPIQRQLQPDCLHWLQTIIIRITIIHKSNLN